MDEKSSEKKVGRRSFLGQITSGAFAVAILGQGWTYFRSLFPNVLYEPPKKFKVGFPREFADGIHFLEDQGIYLIKDGDNFSSVSARCTHLGCTVKLNQFRHEKTVKVGGREISVMHEFLCPCHGSKFYQNGVPYSGPAPSSLPWHALEIAPDDGQLVVDKSSSVDSDYKLVV
jgi:menaquinol-cytochrome c reductase iron-sulfur subunit